MARLVHNTFSAFDAFDDRPALFDGDVELGARLIVVTPLAHALGTVGPALMRLGIPLEIHRTFAVESFVDAMRCAGSAAVHFYPSYFYRLLDEPARSLAWCT